MKTESLKEVLLAALVRTVCAVVVAIACGTGLVGTIECADAAIVYSGPVNIVIPDSNDGLFMNLVTGATSSSQVPGWDINPYSGSPGTFNLWGQTVVTWMYTGPAANSGMYIHLPGTLVDGSSSWARPGQGVNVGTQVTPNADNYLGVQFTNESTSATNFGWLKIAFGSTAGERTITGYAYDNTGAGIVIAAVPEPSVLGLLATGALGLFAVRRRGAVA